MWAHPDRLTRVFFWFVGPSIIIIWYVFTDQNFDYRLLPVGAVAPGLIELPFGSAGPLHSLVFAAALLAVTVIVTGRGSARRRFWMGLPLGVLIHLVLTGAWTSGRIFWWPFFGFERGDADHPIIARGWWNIGLELVGVAVCWWVWRNAELDRPERRRAFIEHGRLALPER